MASKTSDVRFYDIKIGSVNLRVIDTPGFGDTRGTIQDQIHYDRIKEAVILQGGINCVCVV